jgi:bifunctional DNA-binding transcriptional regulator/antitoxin component of YhaV-PrlF toxin-antitoxin module
MMKVTKLDHAGEVKISPRGAVNLPAKVLREVGWEHGDRLWVTIVDRDQIVLSKRPEDIVEYFAGALTHLYPDPEDTRRFLAEERASWDDFDRRLDERA